MSDKTHSLALPICADSLLDISVVGGKAASLARLMQAGFDVPPANVLTTSFFQRWIDTVSDSALWQAVMEAETSALEPACAALRAWASDLAYEPDQLAALGQIKPASVVAVRSSSPEEDLIDASFAGQYETRLGVTAESLEAAVRACFLSCLDHRVIAYKRARGLSIDRPRFAAIIQEQINGDVSGVAFSIDPRFNDFDHVLLNASAGLGEALVSGEITPDSILIDKVTREILEYRPADTNDSAALLSSETTLELTQKIVDIESAFGLPVDVEWTWKDGRLHFLQARPVTGYIPLASEMLTSPGQPRQLYMDAALSKGLTMSGAVSPLTLDMFRFLIGRICTSLIGSAPSTHLKSSVIGLCGSRLYVNLSNVSAWVSPDDLVDEMRISDAGIADIIVSNDIAAYMPTKTPPGLGKLRLIRKVLRAFWTGRSSIFPALRATLSTQRLQANKARLVPQLEAAMAKPIDTSPTIEEFFATEYERLLPVTIGVTLPALMRFFYWGLVPLDKLLNKLTPEQKELGQKIKQGYVGDVVVDMGLQMAALAQKLPPSEFESLEDLSQRLHQGELPAEFLDDWKRFIAAYGCRGPMEMDLSSRRYGDAPDIALRQIADIAGNVGSYDPVAMQARLIGEREHAYRTLCDQLPSKSKRKLQSYYKNIVDYSGLRDTPKLHMVMVSYRIRQYVLVIADRWLADQRIENRQDIFELTIADIAEAEKDSAVDVRSRVAERGRSYRELMARVKHFPQVIDSRGRILRANVATEAGDLVGTPVSPGVVQGPAKVLDDPFSKTIEAGDILVAYTTDPGWTPLFINAAAVLLEVGGELQHGALVAREYGKPCVAGIDQVTTRLKDGDLIEVDGSSGIVRRL